MEEQFTLENDNCSAKELKTVPTFMKNQFTPDNSKYDANKLKSELTFKDQFTLENDKCTKNVTQKKLKLCLRKISSQHTKVSACLTNKLTQLN